MAGAKSDFDGDDVPHPTLGQDRPGVYVQVVSPRRKKARPSVERQVVEAHPVQVGEVEEAKAITVAGETIRDSGVHEQSERLDESGTRTRSFRPSEPANNPGLLVVSIPGPPRMPNISLSGSPLPHAAPAASATLLEAPASLRPEAVTTRGGPSWSLVAGIAALSAIIAAALVVALRSPYVVPSDEPAAHTADAVPVEEPGIHATPAAPTPAVAPATPPAPAQAASRAEQPAAVATKSVQPAKAAVVAAPPARTTLAQPGQSAGMPLAAPPADAPANQVPPALAPAASQPMQEPATGAHRELPDNPYAGE